MEKTSAFYSPKGNWEQHHDEVKSLFNAAYDAYSKAQLAEDPDISIHDIAGPFIGACTRFAFDVLHDEALAKSLQTGQTVDEKSARLAVSKFLEWHILVSSTPRQDESPHRGGLPQIIEFLKTIKETGRLPRGEEEA